VLLFQVFFELFVFVFEILLLFLCLVLLFAHFFEVFMLFLCIFGHLANSVLELHDLIVSILNFFTTLSKCQFKSHRFFVF